MTDTGKIERILEKYGMFCFNINKSGINYAKIIKILLKIENKNKIK